VATTQNASHGSKDTTGDVVDNVRDAVDLGR
jgi:hypothetical protein